MIYPHKYLLPLLIVGLGAILPSMGQALEVNLTEFRPTLDFTVNGEQYRIERIQDTSHNLTGGFAKTSRPCPPFCIHPMIASPGVHTVGEIEVFEFLRTKVSTGRGILIDARTPSWHSKGTIPGSINIPFTTFADPNPDNPKLWSALQSLGVTKKKESASFQDSLKEVLDFFGASDIDESDVFDFTNAKSLLLFCNGPWCDQSPRAIKGLRKIGYPADKLFYYRGGMQDWLIMGLSTIVP